MPDSSDDESEAKAPLSTMEQMLQYFDALDEQYDLLTAAPDSEKSLADNFGGHPLPIQHRARFWPRNDNFQETTCHYHPAIAGDTLNGKLVDKLEALGAQQHAAKQPEFGTQYAYECRSLIAAISYLTDASMQQQVTTASILDSLRDAGSMPAGLESLPQDSIDMAVHLKSCRRFAADSGTVVRTTTLPDPRTTAPAPGPTLPESPAHVSWAARGILRRALGVL
ncbi:hypothetical protein Ctob_009994 [Chrysochromulina tobinii]|uniref:Uncharacterized protein n=1 Tax=Chrysochromulina tobinii TaxID=1460289 RepID=A0A0M0JLM1_9EUKA|nr:hypothetical protein Ctob_009994 [Chrysochromulina tobinii]|eukprot:KOO27237.1 hypothetical protein Ctob_009994 [Chrysochromulina sp. CCMP291]